MRTHLASARAVSELARVDLDVQRLEQRWQRDGDVSLTEFWRECRGFPGRPLREADAVRLAALVKADLRRRFGRGESIPISHYLACFPELQPFDSRVVSLIYEEFCLREEGGESLDVASFCSRYPAWKDSLVSQLQYHRLLSRCAEGLPTTSPSFPEVGEGFEEFGLIAHLGRGGSSRVFLACDKSLGGKRVVLKVSLDRGEEPKTLGSLDHPHIVPVHSVVYQSRSGFRGLVMPYRPGVPLDEIARRLPPEGKPRKARDLWESLRQGVVESRLPLSEEHQVALGQEVPSGDGWKGFPAQGSFPEGVAWIAMVLARTLHYAHRMKTFHRDVKPGNVLLTLNHGPQLLDFNLAESPHSVTRAESAMLGGTLPYMAPEQIEAFLNPDLWGEVGARADIYSLGLVLRELLTGMAPDLPDEELPPARAMRALLDRRVCLVTDVGQFRPEVPHALRSIVSLCLKFNPEERYADAGELAEDLERFLSRAALATAHNPSRRERTANWIYRHRRELSYWTAMTALAGTLLFSLMADQLKPDPSALPQMRQAVLDVESGQAGEAIPVLQKLAEEYPRHPLPRTYLGIAKALSHEFVENEAQLDVDAGLRKPDAASILIDWGRKHPELVGQIVRYVDSQIKVLNQQKQRVLSEAATVKQNAGHEASRRLLERQKHVEDRLHQTWLDLLQLGLKLQPDSLALLQKLPEIDEYFGSYESAHQRLTALINAMMEQRETAQPLAILEWRNRRNRVAVKWARTLLKSRTPADIRHAQDLLLKATTDLGASEPFVLSTTDKSNFQSAPDQVQFVYSFYWIGTETWLELAQLRQDQGSSAEAEAAFKQASLYLKRLVHHGNNALITPPPRLKELEEQVFAALRRRAASRN